MRHVLRRPDRDVDAEGQEARLTAWMADHVAVSFQPHSSGWDVEDRIVASGKPPVPLNLKDKP